MHKEKISKKKNKDVVRVQPTVVIKEEPVEFVPESFLSENKGIQNIKTDNGVPVQPAVFIKQEPIDLDPKPSAFTDVVIMMSSLFPRKTTSCPLLMYRHPLNPPLT
ncbi:hypothetical protein CEXT_572651 [Caerostris extrusa]|uniref:Uncharacterized protein n=1 Tax=Caerostris extrusa TaxID=172846 RepID=A0AAV4Y8N5_CAEEX|nr:hypothetical protein CEXT_572651 [Caerostris extrusa]